MDEDLHKVISAQANVIGRIKRVIVNYKKLPKANVTLTKTRTRLADLEKCWEKQLHDSITFAATDEDRNELSYILQREFLAAEEAYIEAADYLQEAINSFVVPGSPACDPSTDSTCCDGTRSSSLTLPRIPRPIFSGKISEWQKFRHTFQSLVLSDKTMTNIAKFHYLRSSVIGDAAVTLDRFDVTPDSYNDAWEMLLKYDKRALIKKH